MAGLTEAWRALALVQAMELSLCLEACRLAEVAARGPGWPTAKEARDLATAALSHSRDAAVGTMVHMLRRRWEVPRELVEAVAAADASTPDDAVEMAHRLARLRHWDLLGRPVAPGALAHVRWSPDGLRLWSLLRRELGLDGRGRRTSPSAEREPVQMELL